MKIIVIVSFIAVTVFGCDEKLEGVTGTFSSPNYPNDYGNSLSCTWTISIPSGIIQLEFADFELESSSTCSYDRVVVRDSTSTGPILGTYCGTQLPPLITATGRTIIVQLITDSSVAYQGFSANWREASSTPPSVTTPAGGCGGSLSGVTGAFTSPEYPNNYPANSDCTWTLTIPEGVIVLQFTDFSLEDSASECSYDYVKVYDGVSNVLLATMCGTAASTVQGSSNSLRVVFKSDSSVQQKGFSAAWSGLTCENSGSGFVCVADEQSCPGSVKSNFPCESSRVCCDLLGNCGTLPSEFSHFRQHPRIVGGAEAARHSWPWQVSLRTVETSYHFCGGSIVGDRWILTAAHCADGYTSSTLKVTSGEHDRTTVSGRELDHAVERVFIHESYAGTEAGYPNDIALIKLQSPIAFDNYRRPICMADPGDSFLGNSNCRTAGWGYTNGAGKENVLNEVAVSVVEQLTCSNRWGSDFINNKHICAGNGISGTCSGDGGGPLACQMQRDGTERWVLAGVSSFQKAECNNAGGYPSVYSSVTNFKDWITATMRNN